MFQRLTSLFFSDSNTPEGLEEPKPFVEEEEEEDGWLIIDLAEGPSPGGVGSSPMEDLLIEHPSMSVYVTSTLEVDGEGPEDDAHGEVPEPRLERHVPHHSRPLSLKAAILEKVGQARGVDHRSRLPSKAEESPPLEIPKVWPNKCQEKGNNHFPYPLAALPLALAK
ncbi:tumor protein p53-inducible nuclear protein 2 [Egretta garzetta]|uniref:tumor protein p53-inducible nuclear protein 2 n=1 Tax=Egretta garzetta TaxID=188379 RepID=UPI00163C68E1|nr:tumor protein p53-inducible nuclear protein 2 [Egretta garzetta]